MAKVASDVVDDQESNEFVTEMAPFNEKIGSKRASRLPISEPSPKRTMLDLAKERPGAITRLFREFSNKGDALTLAHVALNPGALTVFLEGCVARTPPKSLFIEETKK